MADNKKEDTPGQIDRMIKQMKKEAEDKAEQIIAMRAKQSKAEQCKTEQINAEQSNAKQSKAGQSKS